MVVAFLSLNKTHFRQQVIYGTLPRGVARGLIPEETETDAHAGDLSRSRGGSRGSRGSGGGVAVIQQSGGGAGDPVQGGQLRRSLDGRISLR